MPWFSFSRWVNKGSEKFSDPVWFGAMIGRCKRSMNFPWYIPNTELEPHLWFLAHVRHWVGENLVPLGDQGWKNYPVANMWAGNIWGKAIYSKSWETFGTSENNWGASKETEAQRSHKSYLVSAWDCAPGLLIFLWFHGFRFFFPHSWRPAVENMDLDTE